MRSRPCRHTVSGTQWSKTHLQSSKASERGYTVALLGCREGRSEVFYQITNRNCVHWTFQSFGCISERAAWQLALQRSLLRSDCFLCPTLILCSLQYSWHGTHMSLLNDSDVIVESKDKLTICVHTYTYAHSQVKFYVYSPIMKHYKFASWACTVS